MGPATAAAAGWLALRWPAECRCSMDEEIDGAGHRSGCGLVGAALAGGVPLFHYRDGLRVAGATSTRWFARG